MTTTRAADADCNVGLPFPLILRQQVVQQIRKARERFCDLRLAVQIFHHAPIGAGQSFQPIDKKWVGQVPDIEQQFNISGRAESMTKA